MGTPLQQIRSGETASLAMKRVPSMEPNSDPLSVEELELLAAYFQLLNEWDEKDAKNRE